MDLIQTQIPLTHIPLPYFSPTHIPYLYTCKLSPSVKLPMGSDNHYGHGFWPEFVLSQTYSEDDHKCRQTAIPDYITLVTLVK